MTIPAFVPIHQHFPRPVIDDVATALSHRMRESGLLDGIRPDARIAVTAGSRGIAAYPLIMKTIITVLKHAGTAPFIIPAMGSHGGGTATGQEEVLRSIGISTEAMGAPVRASMETVRLADTPDGVPIYCDRTAYESDGIIVVNRIKVHTAFHGDVESGLSKMLAVGLGKVAGAESMHRCGLAASIPAAARVVLEYAPVLMGVALIENAYDEIMDIRVVAPDRFAATDRELLAVNRLHLPRIPVREFDILIVDAMGKDISGTGMDTNIIGFWRRYGGERDPFYETLIVRSLTPASNGNAMGIGMADLTTRQLGDAVDSQATARNALTAQPKLGVLPQVLGSDRQCIEEALFRCERSDPRIVRIRNTRDLTRLWVTVNLAEALADTPNVYIDGPPASLRFDGEGMLPEDMGYEG